jgi:hypothetical protein
VPVDDIPIEMLTGLLHLMALQLSQYVSTDPYDRNLAPRCE